MPLADPETQDRGRNAIASRYQHPGGSEQPAVSALNLPREASMAAEGGFSPYRRLSGEPQNAFSFRHASMSGYLKEVRGSVTDLSGSSVFPPSCITEESKKNEKGPEASNTTSKCNCFVEAGSGIASPNNSDVSENDVVSTYDSAGPDSSEADNSDECDEFIDVVTCEDDDTEQRDDSAELIDVDEEQNKDTPARRYSNLTLFSKRENVVSDIEGTTPTVSEIKKPQGSSQDPDDLHSSRIRSNSFAGPRRTISKESRLRSNSLGKSYMAFFKEAPNLSLPTEDNRFRSNSLSTVKEYLGQNVQERLARIASQDSGFLSDEETRRRSFSGTLARSSNITMMTSQNDNKEYSSYDLSGNIQGSNVIRRAYRQHLGHVSGPRDMEYSIGKLEERLKNTLSCSSEGRDDDESERAAGVSAYVHREVQREYGRLGMAEGARAFQPYGELPALVPVAVCGEALGGEASEDVVLRLRVLVLLWVLLGERRLRDVGYPQEPVRRVLWRAVDVCCSVAGVKSAAAVPLPQDHDCVHDMACFRDHAHRFLEVCAPTRDLWKKFGWAGLTVDAVVAKIYREELCPCLGLIPLPRSVAAVVWYLENAGAAPRPASRLRQHVLLKKKRGRPAKLPTKGESGRVERVMLWRFLLNLLEEPRNAPCIHWVQRDQGIFRILNTDWLARLWGRRHGNPRMTYEKMARAMRTYYRSKVLQPVPRCPHLPRKLVYKFNPAVVQKVTAAKMAAAAEG